MKRVFALYIYFFAVCFIFAADTNEEINEKLKHRLPAPAQPILFFDDIYEFHPDSKPCPDYADLNNAWLCLKALQFGYEEVGRVMFDTEVNDWCIDVSGTRLYWANGRLLKKEDMQNYEEYEPVIKYYYHDTMLDPKNLTLKEIEELKVETILANHKTRKKDNRTFHEIIYGEFQKESVEEKLVEVNMLGSIIRVHKRVAPAIKKTIIEIQKKAGTPEMKAFLKNHRQSYSFNWRNIADSGRASNHSWGIAIDLIAKKYRNKKVYWFWEASTKEYWMMFTPEERWKPPDAIIKAFENEGFIWGGYWTIWDTMHFEYKPELIYITKFFSSPEPHLFREEINYETLFKNTKKNNKNDNKENEAYTKEDIEKDIKEESGFDKSITENNRSE
ncbi:MAG: peptidase M15 [Treponema sp.]|nr:MAG: peptidase M15 [Treponema sp.]